MLRVLLISEHKLLRQGLSRLLRDDNSPESVTETESGEEALEQLRVMRPDVILLHVAHPVGTRIRVLHLLREKAPAIPVVVLLDLIDDEVMLTAMQAGASGCLDKTVDAGYLVQSLHDAASGEMALSERLARRLARIVSESGKDGARQPFPDALTRREIEVLAFLCHGLTNHEIARSLFISDSTVRAHLRTVTQKLGVHNRAHAVARALELGMVPTPSPPSSQGAAQYGRQGLASPIHSSIHN